jgi:hypothetical protein
METTITPAWYTNTTWDNSEIKLTVNYIIK